MNQFLTDFINIKATPLYREKFSQPEKGEYIFSYKIEIRNDSQDTIQLLSRHWYIFDSCGQYSEVKGEGVIGKQPIILPEQNFSYESFCQLKTDVGCMWGNYLMKNQQTNRLFEVAIPEFQLITPMRLN